MSTSARNHLIEAILMALAAGTGAVILQPIEAPWYRQLFAAIAAAAAPLAVYFRGEQRARRVKAGLEGS